ncbi:MAG TPA: hypothetical protein VME46_21430 [Acidimicrobiales bacterium]|nr:hypothetical protein [Acidimicrobiales bacterium]
MERRTVRPGLGYCLATCTPGPPTSLPTRRSRWGIGAAAFVLLAGLATACGNGSGAPGVAGAKSSPTLTTEVAVPAAATTVPSPASLAAMTKLAACFRKHGLKKFPDPPYADGELDNLGFTKQVVDRYEYGACHGYALAAGAAQTPQEVQQHLQQMLAISKCMRAHGITNFPDPGTQGEMMMSPSIANEPGYAKAAKVCGAPPAPTQRAP